MVSICSNSCVFRNQDWGRGGATWDFKRKLGGGGIIGFKRSKIWNINSHFCQFSPLLTDATGLIFIVSNSSPHVHVHQFMLIRITYSFDRIIQNFEWDTLNWRSRISKMEVKSRQCHKIRVAIVTCKRDLGSGDPNPVVPTRSGSNPRLQFRISLNC